VSVTARAAMPKAPSTKIGMLLDAFTAVPVWVVSPVLRPWHVRWGAATEEVTASGRLPQTDGSTWPPPSG